MRDFDHDRMDVYRQALDFVHCADSLRRAFRPGRPVLADQLERASISIPLNIAEGAGEFAHREKGRFYRMARRSATECAAILDIVRELDLADREAVIDARNLLRSIVAQLIGLGKKMEEEASRKSK